MQPEASARRKKSKFHINSALLVVIVVALIGIVFLRYNSGANSAIDKSGYQAVFLTNGQVYFGKLHEVDSSHVDLQDIYYLQTQQSNKQGSGNDAAEKLENANSEVKLIKLGNELHGPKDRMIITKDQVLFWENLKENGKVVSAIDQYKKTKK